MFPWCGILGKKSGRKLASGSKERNYLSSIVSSLNLKKRVPEIAWELQKELKEKLEKKTGLRVDRIDIYVQGFAIPRKNGNILATD
jgi:uncharacterized alkaline shock family protein YloU